MTTRSFSEEPGNPFMTSQRITLLDVNRNGDLSVQPNDEIPT